MFRAQWQGLRVLFDGTTYQAEWVFDVTDIEPPRRFRLLANLEFRVIGIEFEWVLIEVDSPIARVSNDGPAIIPL